MDRALRDRLVAIAFRDLETREPLARDGGLFDGYRPEMEAVHEENARELENVIEAHGWPTCDRAGCRGSWEPAWARSSFRSRDRRPTRQTRVLRLKRRIVVAKTTDLSPPAWTECAKPPSFGKGFGRRPRPATWGLATLPTKRDTMNAWGGG